MARLCKVYGTKFQDRLNYVHKGCNITISNILPHTNTLIEKNE